MNEDDSIFAAAKPDGFTHESPIRAFTDFKVEGTWAIGKGFRPSLGHLATYLNAMQAKEGWHLVQLLDAGTLDPTLIFQRDRIMSFIIPDRPTGSDAIDEAMMPEIGDRSTVERHVEMRRASGRGPDNPPLSKLDRTHPGRRDALVPTLSADEESPAIEDDCDDQDTSAAANRNRRFDDVNPAHYGGWACGDIGERLSANGYHMLKYVWRLGKKDDPCKEIGKAIRYCDREMVLYRATQHRGGTIFVPNKLGINERPLNRFLEDRIADQSTFTQNIARMLWAGYNVGRLVAIREALAEHQFHLDCGRGLAI